ncbi:MAG TPA: fluoride efflux transporter CrcB [Ignavibacteriaceae bacterium]|jgi:CrcB protein|nr:fluoride efflux transporter CrcB [Ignavibacteriaceae bacterium]
MINYLIVSLGAALGGGLRYWASNVTYRFLPSTFPYGTLAVNIIGSFILGIIIFVFDQKELISPGMKLFLTIGFCGGFTTFSTFSLETINLLKDSQFIPGLLNILLNLFLCLAGVALAYFISKVWS